MDSYKIEWHDSLQIGNKLIDDQHKKLIELISTLSESISSQDSKYIEEVFNYTKFHFKDEEDFLISIRYDDIKKQQKEHKKLKKFFNAYKKDYENGNKDLYAFKYFMFRWIRDHIMDEDKKIKLFLESKF